MNSEPKILMFDMFSQRISRFLVRMQALQSVRISVFNFSILTLYFCSSARKMVLYLKTYNDEKDDIVKYISKIYKILIVYMFFGMYCMTLVPRLCTSRYLYLIFSGDEHVLIYLRKCMFVLLYSHRTNIQNILYLSCFY